MSSARPAVEVLSMEEKETKGRMSLYINKSLIKDFKHLAIDEDKDLSALAELAMSELLEKKQKLKQ